MGGSVKSEENKTSVHFGKIYPESIRLNLD